jgi:acetyl esterase/lipase
MIRRRTWALLFLVAGLLVVGFLLVDSPAPTAETTVRVVVEKDVIYGKGESEALRLDLARPEQPEGLLPAIVYIHGGGWLRGSRSDYWLDIQDAATRGYVAVTIDYRLTDPDKSGKAKYPFPAQIEDCKCAVRWLRANAARYHIDPARIGATGSSAGGHLSLLLGAAGAIKKFEGTGGHPDQSSKVQAVVNYYGPTDLIKMYGYNKDVDAMMATLCGGQPQVRAEEFRAASPVTYVSKETCPILTIHGTKDGAVPVEQAREMDAALHKAGVSCALLVLDGEGHGFEGLASERAKAATFDFFEQHLKHAQ